MSKFIKKLQVLGAWKKKYISRSAMFINFLDNAKIVSIGGDLFCIEDNNSNLKHVIYFCDDLNNLLQFLNDQDEKVQLSLGREEFEFLSKKFNFSKIKSFECYRLTSFDKANTYKSIKRIEEFDKSHYPLIKDFSPLHQTEFGQNEVIGLVNELGYGLIGSDGSFLYVEDHPKLNSRFGSTLYSKGSGIEVLKLLSQSINDFKSTGLKEYFTYLEPENQATIKLHEKLGFDILSPSLSLCEVIS